MEAAATILIGGLSVDAAELAELCRRYGVAELAVFGSVARGEAMETSDVDLLYVLAPGVRLGFGINALEDELAILFERPVDLARSGRCTNSSGMTSLPRLARCMQRDRLLLAEVIDAAERLIELTAERTPTDFEADRDRRDALPWNFTVLGEAVAQVSEAVKGAHPHVGWSDPVRLRNRIVHGYWSVDLDVLVATARDDLSAFIGQIRTIEDALPDKD